MVRNGDLSGFFMLKKDSFEVLLDCAQFILLDFGPSERNHIFLNQTVDNYETFKLLFDGTSFHEGYDFMKTV